MTKYSRRISVVRSASGDGASLSSANRAPMKASSGLVFFAGRFPTAGTAGRRTGWKDQCDLSGSDSAGASAGNFAPWSIQARRSPISAAVSGSPLAGILVSGTRPATSWISGLPALSPGLMAGEYVSPPRSAAAGESSR